MDILWYRDIISDKLEGEISLLFLEVLFESDPRNVEFWFIEWVEMEGYTCPEGCHVMILLGDEGALDWLGKI